jgi:hypothetical protein
VARVFRLDDAGVAEDDEVIGGHARGLVDAAGQLAHGCMATPHASSRSVRKWRENADHLRLVRKSTLKRLSRIPLKFGIYLLGAD